MFFKTKQVVFKTEAELQQYIDKKINNTITSLLNNFNNRIINNRGISERVLNQLWEKVALLEKFLGVEFTVETTTGYKKVKKSKKK